MSFLNGIGATMVLAYLAAIFGGLIGWVMNIVAVVHGLSGPMTTMLIARIVGIPVFILGAILGVVVMNGKELNDVRHTIEKEGFDYAFIHYSDFPDIKDEEFHKLRLAYCDAHGALSEYLGVGND